MINKKRVFYSQNREDLILLSFLKDIENGFYIDIGAYDPDMDSVTKLFYEKGWCGINIEPQKDRFVHFERKRQRDINLNIGVSDRKTNLIIRSYNNQGLSTFSDTIKSGYEAGKNDNAIDFTEYSVPILTLKEVYSKYAKGKTVNFLKIDVEGLEYEVLKGNDWSLCRPQVVCIEANHVVKEWDSIFIKNNYEEVFDDGLNKYFVDALTDVKNNFDYVETVVMEREGGISYEDYKKISLLTNDLTQMTASLKTLQAQNQDLILQRDKLQAKLANFSGLKAQLKSLAHTINDKMISKVEKFGKAPKVSEIIFSAKAEKGSNLMLNADIYEYDQRTFSDSRLFGSLARRTLYRILKSMLGLVTNLVKVFSKVIKKMMGK